MKQHRLNRLALKAVPLFFLFTFSGWAAAGQTEEAAPATAAEPEMATEAEVPAGLDIVMDGTNLETWEQSMEEVREVGGEQTYLSLKGGIDYLLVFDIGANNDLATLVSRLNGMTGNEILARVKYRRK